MRLIDVDLYCATICKCNRRACDRAKCPIHNAPTAYDIDRVVEELESEKRYGSKYDSYYEENLYRGEMFENDVNNKTIDKAIEIVKNGGVYEAEQKLKEMESD